MNSSLSVSTFSLFISYSQVLRLSFFKYLEARPVHHNLSIALSIAIIKYHFLNTQSQTILGIPDNIALPNQVF